MSKHIALKEKPIRSRAFHMALAVVKNEAPTPTRWACHHHAGGSDIEAYVPVKDGLDIIGQMKQTNGVNARANAELVVQAVNERGRYYPMINELIAALELCLENDSLTWEAEQEADIVLRRAKKIIAL